jgi:hypothetical protein
MRSLNELYTILYNNIKDLGFITGLCGKLKGLEAVGLITEDEHEALFNHFKSQKPSWYQHSEFTESDTWSGSIWWWSSYEDCDPINRKAFILKMIEITK